MLGCMDRFFLVISWRVLVAFLAGDVGIATAGGEDKGGTKLTVAELAVQLASGCIVGWIGVCTKEWIKLMNNTNE